MSNDSSNYLRWKKTAAILENALWEAQAFLEYHNAPQLSLVISALEEYKNTVASENVTNDKKAV